MENKENGLSIDLRPEVARGVYSNLAIITHSRNEFVVDFAAMMPGMPKPEVGSRVVMTPENAKRLLMALQDNIQKFESQFGSINPDSGVQPKGTFNLNDFAPFGGGGNNIS